jgi:hypothetical protein
VGASPTANHQRRVQPRSAQTAGEPPPRPHRTHVHARRRAASRAHSPRASLSQVARLAARRNAHPPAAHMQLYIWRDGPADAPTALGGVAAAACYLCKVPARVWAVSGRFLGTPRCSVDSHEVGRECIDHCTRSTVQSYVYVAAMNVVVKSPIRPTRKLGLSSHRPPSRHALTRRSKTKFGADVLQVTPSTKRERAGRGGTESLFVIVILRLSSSRFAL